MKKQYVFPEMKITRYASMENIALGVSNPDAPDFGDGDILD